MNQIIMLGTGNATVTQCYNTCFLLETSTTRLLVDAGGGNGVLRQLQRAGVAIRDLHHLFVTHAHTDHVLGVIWVIRMVAQCKDYEGHLHVYGHDKVLLVLRTIIDMILAKSVSRFARNCPEACLKPLPPMAPRRLPCLPRRLPWWWPAWATNPTIPPTAPSSSRPTG